MSNHDTTQQALEQQTKLRRQLLELRIQLDAALNTEGGSE